jgi:hypothetical protein
MPAHVHVLFELRIVQVECSLFVRSAKEAALCKEVALSRKGSLGFGLGGARIPRKQEGEAARGRPASASRDAHLIDFSPRPAGTHAKGARVHVTMAQAHAPRC